MGRQQTPQGAPVQDAVVPEGLGYALGHRKPRMNFHETRKARQYLDDLRGVLELTVSPDEQYYHIITITSVTARSVLRV